MYSANHLTYLTAGDALVRWSPLVEAEGEEQMSCDVAGTASMRCGGGGLARSSDGLAFAARPTAAAVALRGHPRSSDRGSRRRVASGSGLARSSGGVAVAVAGAGAGVAGAASRPFAAEAAAARSSGSFAVAEQDGEGAR